MTFATISKMLREEIGFSQKELGAALGISASGIGHLEIGRHEPNSTTLIAYAKYFNVTTDYLLGADEWTAEERAQGVIDHKKISVSADEETLIECYRTIGRKFGKKKQENFIKLAELYTEEED